MQNETASFLNFDAIDFKVKQVIMAGRSGKNQ